MAGSWKSIQDHKNLLHNIFNWNSIQGKSSMTASMIRWVPWNSIFCHIVTIGKKSIRSSIAITKEIYVSEENNTVQNIINKFYRDETADQCQVAIFFLQMKYLQHRRHPAVWKRKLESKNWSFLNENNRKLHSFCQFLAWEFSFEICYASKISKSFHLTTQTFSRNLMLLRQYFSEGTDRCESYIRGTYIFRRAKQSPFTDVKLMSFFSRPWHPSSFYLF